MRFLPCLSIIAAMVSLTPASHAATITYYTTRASFNTAEPGLPLETFSPISTPAVIAAPLSSTTNNSDFAAGNILPGISISNKNTASSANGLYVGLGAVSPTISKTL